MARSGPALRLGQALGVLLALRATFLRKVRSDYLAFPRISALSLEDEYRPAPPALQVLHTKLLTFNTRSTSHHNRPGPFVLVPVRFVADVLVMYWRRRGDILTTFW